MAKAAEREKNVEVSIRGPVARVTLNRPERHNAFDDKMIASLASSFDVLAKQSAVRVVVLAGAGRSFSAGADLDWMKRTASYGAAENEADAAVLAGTLGKLNFMPKPTVALVQGGAYGGGVGLVVACDIAIAAEDAIFSLSEVKLGIIPSVISPYVVAAIGPRAARRYFLTAERFGAHEAHRIGLVHEVVPVDDLAAAGERMVSHLLNAGPEAAKKAKKLIADVEGRTIDAGLMAETARRIAEARSSPEGQEGIAAFLERRKPSWRRD
jgi:methylglutaconyl-CoA hydratase